MKRIAVFLALLAMQSSALAACLSGNPTVRAEFEASPIVLIGRVLSENPVPATKDYFEGEAYFIAVKEVLRGRAGKTISLFSENSSGRFPMKVGASYLLFLHKELGLWQVDNCGNSGLLSKSIAALDIVRSLHNEAQQVTPADRHPATRAAGG